MKMIYVGALICLATTANVLNAPLPAGRGAARLVTAASMVIALIGSGKNGHSAD